MASFNDFSPSDQRHLPTSSDNKAKQIRWNEVRQECVDFFISSDQDEALQEKRIEYYQRMKFEQEQLRKKEVDLFNPEMKLDSKISRTGWTNSDLKLEKKASEILQKIKAYDEAQIAQLPPRKGYHNQSHPRFVGDHFLANVDWITKESWVFQVARKMPKGAHLHVHFNSCLPENFLLDLAMEEEQLRHMYIRCKIPLNSEEGFRQRDIQFTMLKDDDPQALEYIAYRKSLRSIEYQKRNRSIKTRRMVAKETSKQSHPVNIWGENYSPRVNEVTNNKEFRCYKFEDFLKEFKDMYTSALSKDYIPRDPIKYRGDEEGLPTSQTESAQLARDWLMQKLVFEEKEAHNECQTVIGAWDNFNCRTRMMKGLFNYVRAYEAYIDTLLDHFVEDNIQYAEIRPNFMSTNQLFTVGENGTQTYVDNFGIMDIIVSRFEQFQRKFPPGSPSPLQGLQVIYCMPRSFSRDKIRWGLEQCIIFKKIWPDYIAGFDLVGPEFQGEPLKTFTGEFLTFVAQCKKLDIEIPFAFHCGETYQWGGSTDGNLFDAATLANNVRRIGHGVGLINHPALLERFREKKICVEVCPISNEELGLNPRIGSHAVYPLLANGIHVAIAGDNGTLFRSTLSHDMYQIQVGQPQMTLAAWRQLAEWSIEHALTSEHKRECIRMHWQDKWRAFLKFMIKHGDHYMVNMERILEDQNNNIT